MTNRDDKRFHPVADIFPLMVGTEFFDLAKDIENYGLIEPIALHPDGSILDGRNRYRACIKAGVDPIFQTWNLPGSEIEFVISRNVHRRHLTRDQKRQVIAALLKLAPERSNRQIAKDAKVDHKTVGAERAELEATGEIPQINKTTGTDGKARPAKKVVENEADPDDDDHPEPLQVEAALKRQKLSRPAQWSDAVSRAVDALEELQDLQAEYEEWLDGIPDNLRDGTLFDKLEGVTVVDFASAIEVVREAEDVDLPLGYGRD